MSHVAAGGAMPGWLGVVVPWSLAAMICTVLAGRSLSLWRMSIAVVLSQLTFHTLFVVGAVAPGAQTTGHVHGAMVMPAASTSPMTTGHSDLAMWIGHGVAAILTIMVIFRGEAAVWRLLAIAREFATALGRRIATPALVGVVAEHPVLPVSTPVRVMPSFGWFPSTTARRGPPRRLV